MEFKIQTTYSNKLKRLVQRAKKNRAQLFLKQLHLQEISSFQFFQQDETAENLVVMESLKRSYRNCSYQNIKPGVFLL